MPSGLRLCSRRGAIIPWRTSALIRFGLPRVASKQGSVLDLVQYPSPAKGVKSSANKRYGSAFIQEKAQVLNVNPHNGISRKACSRTGQHVHINRTQSFAANASIGSPANSGSLIVG